MFASVCLYTCSHVPVCVQRPRRQLLRVKSLLLSFHGFCKIQVTRLLGQARLPQMLKWWLGYISRFLFSAKKRAGKS